MAEERHLARAPITEAIIDFRVRLPEGFQADRFAGLKEKLHDKYPKASERRFVKKGFQLINGKQVSQVVDEKGLDGYIFKSEDELAIAQFRIDGFTFNKLNPYTSWEEVSREASVLWDLYVDIASPETINRIAVRYINHLNIPLPLENLSRYFNTTLPVPGSCPGNMRSFLQRVVVRDPELGISANITHALEESVDPQFVTVILDIDVYKVETFTIHDQRIWPTFESLRKMKNQIFFGSITEETAGLYE